MTSSIGKMKSVSTAEDDSMFKLCLREIDEMGEMRFIEKICSPIKKEIKEQYYAEFYVRFMRLHQGLDLIFKDWSQVNYK
jgi:hypothetical protein